MVAVVVGGVAVGASASAVTSATAGIVPAKNFTYQGLRVAMPGASSAALVSGGVRVPVVVKPQGRQPKARVSARITVTRAASGGEKAATLVRKSLRKGEVRFPLSSRIGVKYQVQVQIGKRRWVTRLQTSDNVPSSRPPVPSGPCTPAGTITADVATAVAGGTLPFHITNTGNAVLTYGSGNGWTQLVGGVWSNVLSPGGLGPAITSTIAPGETKTGKGSVWSTLTPGTYSMTVVATCATTNADGSATFKAIPLQTTPITVTAAAGR